MSLWIFPFFSLSTKEVPPSGRVVALAAKLATTLVVIKKGGPGASCRGPKFPKQLPKQSKCAQIPKLNETLFEALRSGGAQKVTKQVVTFGSRSLKDLALANN